MPWRCLFHPSCLVAGLRGKSDDRQGILAGRPSQVRHTSFYAGESLPEFLLHDSPVVKIADVIQELELDELSNEFDSEVMLTRSIRFAVPEWFVVIESDSRPTET